MTQDQGKQANYLGIGAAVVIVALILIAVLTQAMKPDIDDVAENATDTSSVTATDSDDDDDTEGDNDIVIDAEPTATTTTTPTTTDPVPNETAKALFDYENGTYTMVGSYNSPAGPEQIGVTVTLKNDLITAVSVDPMATAPASVKWQGTFADNYTPLVLGKNIDEVSLTKVSGSSLTPKGFNDALTKIKAEAEIQS